ncbi:MAG TPA: hypothetical protein VG738_18730 [Chitinophagaceae bacterium]|nr:hypothetical protein [Chitinophagaceae bacterium]
MPRYSCGALPRRHRHRRFFAVEEETGLANCVKWESLFDEFRNPILQSSLLLIENHL